MTAKELAEQCEAYVIGLRREFHMHPELSLQEEWTSARIASELKAMGIPYEIVGHRNVVGHLQFAKPGKAIAIRADFDALPLTEETDVPFKSQIPGCMHACGHDAHAAVFSHGPAPGWRARGRRRVRDRARASAQPRVRRPGR